MKGTYYKLFNYQLLKSTTTNTVYNPATDFYTSYNASFIMFDTETSKMHDNEYDAKEKKYKPVVNYVVAWSIAIRNEHKNICVVWGRRPSELAECLRIIRRSMPGENIILYAHNLAYDWTFCKKFIIREFGTTPDKQLNIRSQYPVSIRFNDIGIVFKDSAVLAQRTLEDWAEDLNVEHKKMKGKWDYKKIRSQDEDFSNDEEDYFCSDVLAGVECLDAMAEYLKVPVNKLPLTATGIVRREVQKRGRKAKAHAEFTKSALDFEDYENFSKAFHGGYTHCNRNCAGYHYGVYDDDTVICRDFTSSYPFVMACMPIFPQGKMVKSGYEITITELLKRSQKECFVAKVIITNAELKPGVPMPVLMHSKNEYATENYLIDNGRYLEVEKYIGWFTDLDLVLIKEQYDADIEIEEYYSARKGYMPKWYRDYVIELFIAKCNINKDEDPVGYALAKIRLNSLFGFCAQHPCKDIWVENYSWTEESEVDVFFKETDTLSKEEVKKYHTDMYDEYLENKKTMIGYQYAPFITAGAQYNLFRLSRCLKDDGVWIYGDTDSIFATGWNDEKIEKYIPWVRKIPWRREWQPTP